VIIVIENRSDALARLGAVNGAGGEHGFALTYRMVG
jgi:hypothetical protein